LFDDFKHFQIELFKKRTWDKNATSFEKTIKLMFIPSFSNALFLWGRLQGQQS